MTASPLARSLTSEVEFSAEDASRTEYGYLLEVLRAVHEAGASVLNIPDTVGYSLPHEYALMVRNLVREGRQVVSCEEMEAPFLIEPFARHCLMEGIDELGFLLSREAAISVYEQRR